MQKYRRRHSPRLGGVMLAAAFLACSSSEPSGGRAGHGGSSEGSGGGSGLGGTTGPGGSGFRVADSGTILTEDGACSAIVQEPENVLQPADIIWAIDNSCSMANEAAALRQNMGTFAQIISSSGIDVHIVLISDPDPLGCVGTFCVPNPLGECIPAPLGSGNCPDDSNPQTNYLHINVDVDSHNALDRIVESYPQYQPLMRANATKTFVVVTDDEATTAPNDSAAAFTSSVAGLDPTMFAQWKFDGIYCFSQCPSGANQGTVYEALRVQTNGSAGNLCLQDFNPVFDALAHGVVSGASISCDWAIPAPVDGQMVNPKKVNVRLTENGTDEDIFNVPTQADCANGDGWYYDDNATPTRVLACPSTCSKIQGSQQNGAAPRVQVLFGCAIRPRPIN